MTRYIFITGGVVSSLGKGLTAASLASLLQLHGYKVKLRKFDPYLNIDPGTMNPFQHGEVFVTEDGVETDLDLGHYERFTDVPTRKGDSITAGKIYQKLLKKERKGDYLGGTVQVIPHVTDLIKEAVIANTSKYDFVLCEIGGTVGDIEGLPFFEAIRQLGNCLGHDKVLYIHLTLVPYISAAKELKTKPTQHSVKELRSIGIQPNILVCRCDREISDNERHKIALFCNLSKDTVITAIDVKTIYQAPISLHENNLDNAVLQYFNLPNKSIDLSKWADIVNRINNPSGVVRIAIVGKYIKLSDAYISLTCALEHAGIHNNVSVQVKWIGARTLNADNIKQRMQDIDAVLVPGGFGTEGVDGKILAVQYARENNLPFLGICLGMQIAVIEFARNVLGVMAESKEVVPDTDNPIVVMLSEWLQQDGNVEKRDIHSALGGTMRLGNYPCKLRPNSLIAKIYDEQEVIHERHRHRYEVNSKYVAQLEAAGMQVTGTCVYAPDLPEVVELPEHPWFVGVQYHPEFKSTPAKPSPLFNSFIAAIVSRRT